MIQKVSAAREKILKDPEIGEVVFRKSARARRMAIRVHSVRGVSISVPALVPYAAAMAFFKLKRDWVLQTLRRQKDRIKDVPIVSASEINEMRSRAKAELPPRLAELAQRYGFTYNRVTIKHNSSNWGSCSILGNINLNLNVVRLPNVLRDYILLHELCHLRHHDHGQAFHLLLEHVLTDNLVKRCDEGDESALELARKAAVSRARYPVDHVMTRSIKAYRLV
jgi:predicted metal-dependent hydrolase